MPIDERMVKWDEPSSPKIDSRMVKWDTVEAPKGAEPYQFDSPFIPSLMSIGQGATLGWGDEFAGKLGADSARYRATVDAHDKEYPISSMAGKLGAGAVVPFAAGLTAGLPPLGAAITAGAIGTAAQMAGDAPEGNRTNEAAKGALYGMALGPAAMGMMKPVSAIGDALVSQASRLPRVGESIADRLAGRRLVESFGMDNATPESVGVRMQELGNEARMVDGAGVSTGKLLDLQATMPGKTANMLEGAIENRIKTRPDRLEASVVDLANPGYGRANEVLTSLVAQKQSASAPLYDKLHKMVIKPSTALQGDIDAALSVSGIADSAKNIAKLNQSTFTLGDPQLAGKAASMKDIDHLKQGIDDYILRHTKEGVMDSEAYAANKLRIRLLGQADFLTSGKYKVARDAYAGPAALEDAVNSGMRFMQQDATKLERAFSQMSLSEQEAFRVGASEGLRTKVGSQGGATELLGATTHNKNLREKLRVMYGDDVKYEKALKMLENERQLKKMEGLGRGSMTASRLLGAEDQGQKVMEDAGNLIGATQATGYWPALKGLMSGKAIQSSAFGTPEAVRDSIGKQLLARHSPQDIQRLIAIEEELKRKASGGAAMIGATSGQIPGLLYQ